MCKLQLNYRYFLKWKKKNKNKTKQKTLLFTKFIYLFKCDIIPQVLLHLDSVLFSCGSSFYLFWKTNKPFGLVLINICGLRFISFDHSLSLSLSLSLSVFKNPKPKSPSLFSLFEAWIGNWELGDGVGGEVGWGNRELLRIAPSSSCPNSRLLFCSSPHSRASLSHRPPLVRRLVRRHLHFLLLRNWGTTHFLSQQLNFTSFLQSQTAT